MYEYLYVLFYVGGIDIKKKFRWRVWVLEGIYEQSIR